MNKELIDYIVNHQIENNEKDLELLNMQLEFYNKLLKNVNTKEEKEKYQKKIKDIIRRIDNKIIDISKLYNLD
ncbi:MAG: hypothetical protein IJ105_02995 [Bacilli bacterium]|nr:hypothetical protein [Bacilli bacterium]